MQKKKKKTNDKNKTVMSIQLMEKWENGKMEIPSFGQGKMQKTTIVATNLINKPTNNNNFH